jgi:hypothetical protein
LPPEKFDESGSLIDDKAKELIRELLDTLVAWTRKLKIT